jgi:hypothetical protein
MKKGQVKKTSKKAASKVARTTPSKPTKKAAVKRSVLNDKPWLAKTPAAELCRAADSAGLPVDYYAETYSPKTPPEVVQQARHLEASWNGYGHTKVRQLGGTVRR